MSKTSAEIAGDVTAAWLSVWATKVAQVPGMSAVTEFYKAVYETIESCVYPNGRIKGPVPKPPGY